MGKKYEFTGETKQHVMSNGSTLKLQQIRSTRDFINSVTGKFIQSGTLGGWIESKDNLSQEGSCWLEELSEAHGNSLIQGDAYVELSGIFDNANVEGNAHIINSYILDNALVMGNCEVSNSRIWDESVIAGHSIVKHSELKNVRTLVGSNDPTTWETYHFERCNLRSNTHLVQILKSCHLLDVEMSGKRIQFHSPVSLRNVTALEIGNLQVECSLVMESVLIEPKSNVKFKKGKEQSVLGGDRDNPIILNSGNLVIDNCNLEGSVQIIGKWILSKTSLKDYATLKNDWTSMHYIVNSTLRDFASLLCNENYSGGTKTDSYQLSMEDCQTIK
ncbi:hypothetical protein [Rossellomorea marisflavi]|uniref:hypothetical protein n=1 Tax=Rossellomorea marisflavi TaxID=189381 RepID=UPI003F9FB60E